MARILMLTPQPPYPPMQGTSLRNWHMLRALAEVHDVTLLSFSESTSLSHADGLRRISELLPAVEVPTRSGAKRLGQIFVSPLPDVALRLESEDYLKALERALETTGIDAVQIEGIELARYMSQVRSANSALPIVLDCHNAETRLQERAFRTDLSNPRRWPAALYSRLQIGRLADFECEACLEADRVIAVSESDSQYLKDLCGNTLPPVRVIPNTVDIFEYKWSGPIPQEQKFDLLFTGKMDYRPNVDGILWFADEVWPTIRERFPTITWGIVGQRPHARLDRLKSKPGITLTGCVDQIQPYLAGARVYILPLRLGSGTRLKLIEAMSAGKAIVSTTLGAEGFPVLNGRELLLADSASEMAKAIISLLENPTLGEQLSNNAQAFVQAYDWRSTISLVAELYEELIDLR
ncbi:MAG: glycosyltransferase [Chloroflexota bacterium]